MKTTKIRKQKLVHEKHTLNDKQIFFFLTNSIEISIKITIK